MLNDRKESKSQEIFASGNIDNAFLLKKSGNILTVHHQNNQYEIKLWDIHSKKIILAHHTDSTNIIKYLLPTGSLLSQIDDELVMNPDLEQAFYQSVSRQRLSNNHLHFMIPSILLLQIKLISNAFLMFLK